MTLRAVFVGLMMGLFVAATTYFNDQVIRQSMLIGHHLPVIVFGLVALLLFTINPLLKSQTRFTALSPPEVAIICVIALSACGWPGNSFYRGFGSIVSLPTHWGKTETNWISADVMSFVPGGSGELAPEHLPNSAAFARLLVEAGHQQDAAPSPTRRLWRLLDESGQTQARRLAEDDAAPPRERAAFTDSVNRVLANPNLYDPAAFADAPLPQALRNQLVAARSDKLDPFLQQRLNRELLARALPNWVLPAPRGEGALLQGGRPNTPAQQLLRGGPSDPNVTLSVTELPWRAWWPTIWLWGRVAICLGLAALCLALVVHPQWSLRELLPYPIPRFVHELSRTEPGRWLPSVARHRSFWIALGCIVAIHLLNGLHAYYPTLPTVPLRLDFGALRELFPNASRVFGSYAYFEPFIFPVAIAFALFLTSSVSFSLGISHLLFMMLGAVLLSQGISFDRDYLGGSRVNMMAFGSFLAALLMIIYVGRRYYVNLLGAMVGLRRDESTPAYAVRAGWGLVLALCGAVALLYHGGLPLPLGIGLVLLIMLLWLIMSRISAETGLFLVKTGWLPVGVMTALLGFEAIGPTSFIFLALATVVLVGEIREAIMPFLVNGLRIAERADRPRVPRTARWMAVMLVVSLLVAGAASLTLQHNRGLDMNDTFITTHLAKLPFNELSRHVAQARAEQSMDAAVTASAAQRWSMIGSEPGAYRWAALGFALVLIAAAARLRLPWWPLHPVIFLVWGTWPMFVLSFSFLLGWMVKTAIVSVGGAKAYHAAVPIAVGVILGDIISALGWSIVGAAYFFQTGFTPPRYAIFP